MNKYRVEWTERHVTEVFAKDEESAYELALEKDPEITLKEELDSDVELIEEGGYEGEPIDDMDACKE